MTEREEGSELAMNYIGENNYCADVLLSDSTWGAAISASTYWEEVLSGLVPTMTSATTPSGVVSAEQSHPSYLPYLMFDGNDTTRWVSNKVVTTGGAAVSTWVQYEFPSAVRINKIKALSYSSNAITQTLAIEVQGSNDGTNFTSLATGTAKAITTSDYDYEVNFANNGKYKYYRMVCTSQVTSASGSQNNLPQLYTMQLYGHVDLPPVDDRINAKADKTDIAPVENGTTASRPYVVDQQFYLSDGKLYRCKQPIAQGATFTIGTNCELADCLTEQLKEDLLLSVDNLSINYNTNYDTGISVSNCLKYKQIRIVTRHSGSTMINSMVVPIIPSLNYIGATYNTCYFNGTNHMMLICPHSDTNLYIQLSTNFTADSYKITGIDIYGIK